MPTWKKLGPDNEYNHYEHSEGHRISRVPGKRGGYGTFVLTTKEGAKHDLGRKASFDTAERILSRQPAPPAPSAASRGVMKGKSKRAFKVDMVGNDLASRPTAALSTPIFDDAKRQLKQARASLSGAEARFLEKPNKVRKAAMNTADQHAHAAKNNLIAAHLIRERMSRGSIQAAMEASKGNRRSTAENVKGTFTTPQSKPSAEPKQPTVQKSVSGALAKGELVRTAVGAKVARGPQSYLADRPGGHPDNHVGSRLSPALGTKFGQDARAKDYGYKSNKDAQESRKPGDRAPKAPTTPPPRIPVQVRTFKLAKGGFSQQAKDMGYTSNRAMQMSIKPTTLKPTRQDFQTRTANAGVAAVKAGLSPSFSGKLIDRASRASKTVKAKSAALLTQKSGVKPGFARTMAAPRASAAKATAGPTMAAGHKQVGNHAKYGPVMQGKKGGKYVMHNGKKYYGDY